MFTELNYGQDRLWGLDFQVEQKQHSVQAEKKNCEISEVLSPRLNLGQPKAISVAPVGRKAFAAIWLLSSPTASLPAPATTCTGYSWAWGIHSSVCGAASKPPSQKHTSGSSEDEGLALMPRKVP